MNVDQQLSNLNNNSNKRKSNLFITNNENLKKFKYDNNDNSVLKVK